MPAQAQDKPLLKFLEKHCALRAYLNQPPGLAQTHIRADIWHVTKDKSPRTVAAVHMTRRCPPDRALQVLPHLLYQNAQSSR